MPSPRWNLPDYDATGRQKTKIAQLCIALRISDNLEDHPMTQGEAGRLVRELSDSLRRERAIKRTRRS